MESWSNNFLPCKYILYIIHDSSSVYCIGYFVSHVSHLDIHLIFVVLFCSDDTVEVGADLYVIDTEATASATIISTSTISTSTPEAASTPAPAAAVANTQPPPATATATTTTTTSNRTPSIHFRGKDGWAQLKASSHQQPKAPTVIYIPPMYGRPAFTEQEIEALITGGANTAPVVKQHSSGAVFGYI
jgi:hypothetical protein